jgi:phospholipid transport system substrate-binding protein
MMVVASRSRFHRSVGEGALALALMLTVLVPSAKSAQDASSFITDVGSRGIQALRPDIPSPDRLLRFRQLLQEAFDLPGIGLFALGRYRSSTTPQEQQEFFRLYPDLTIRALSTRLDEYGGGSFRVTTTRPFGAETVVSSELVRANGSRVQMDWYLTDSGSQYRITDVTVAGVSMKAALREQFASWIETNGGRVSALLAVLRQQTAQLR